MTQALVGFTAFLVLCAALLLSACDERDIYREQMKDFRDNAELVRICQSGTRLFRWNGRIVTGAWDLRVATLTPEQICE